MPARISAGAAAWVIALSAPVLIRAGEPTTGWLGASASAFVGYTLFAPMASSETFLVDPFGRRVHAWTAATMPGNSVYLLEDGRLLRTARVPGPLPPISAGGFGGRIEFLDWASNLLWRYTYSSATVQHHHDVEMLPNGNVLILAWELKSTAEAIAAGRDPGFITQNAVWPEHIVEVMQTGPTTGTIVWEWHLWDHLIQDFDPTKANFGVVADHPERVNVNAGPNGSADWIHANSIDYNADLDQIIISANRFDEIWIIDHSTTTLEAAGSTGGTAGRGGDVLYRWGNPQMYDRGTAADRKLFRQHCAEWIPASFPGGGNIMIFNNGVGRPGDDYTTIDEIAPPVDAGGSYSLAPGAAYGPSTTVWTYAAANPTDFFASFISGARRLPNGNTVICDGPQGRFFEVTNTGETVWSYTNPVAAFGMVTQQGVAGASACFRVNRFPASYAGLAGRDLTPGAPLEAYPLLFDYDANGVVGGSDFACFVASFTGPCAAPPCLDPLFENANGFLGDADADGDVDCDDWVEFRLAWTGGPVQLPVCGADFRRGDATTNGSVDIADAVRILGYLFGTDVALCEQALDANDDDGVEIGDAVYLLAALFSGGPAVPSPTACGPDPTGRPLPCDSYPCP